MSTVRHRPDCSDASPKLTSDPGGGNQTATRLSRQDSAALPKVRKVYPSDANFLLVKVDDADAMYSYLTEHGVIVRNRNKVTGCGNCLRFTVGTPEENARVVALLENSDIHEPTLLMQNQLSYGKESYFH